MILKMSGLSKKIQYWIVELTARFKKYEHI